MATGIAAGSRNDLSGSRPKQRPSGLARWWSALSWPIARVRQASHRLTANLSKLRGPLHTTEIVLGEACWHLGGNTQPVHALLGLVRMGAIQILHPWPGHLERTQELMMKYSRMDAADASLVMLSEIHRDAKIITTERRDFSIYRRFGRQRLPVIFPPA